MAQPKYLNLDEILEDKFVVKLGGQDHEMKHATLEHFLMNIKDLEALGRGPSIEQEMEISRKMLLRAFPTMTSEMISALTMSQINALVRFAHDANGQKETEDNIKKEETKGSENPPAAAK